MLNMYYMKKKKKKKKPLMQIKRQNYKICKVSLGGNDNIKKLVKIFKAKTKC